MKLSKDAATNRKFWDNFSDEYQGKHAQQLNRKDFVWGVWSLPERDIGALGDVRGQQVLELGSGAAQLSIAIAEMGGYPTALDNSEKQLEHAERLMAEAGHDFPLLHASADKIPAKKRSFDMVFCDHGAMTYAPTAPTLSEVHRVLKKNGLFVFNIQSPLHEICYDDKAASVGKALCKSYFDLNRFVEDKLVYFQYSYGEWVRLFRDAGFSIIDLIELQPPEDAMSSFDFAPLDWAQHFPCENIWVLQKAK
jgi:ubiquinone/menaquinone biosynthesis C-methylase UbiE|tara:strand:+ start:20473 stop:21225 length:753 start_codon:yes stop_codon:yes gene_type:complete